MINSFSDKVKELLEYYLYALVDPRDDSVFYIDKGVGDRAFSRQSSEDNILSQIEKISAINKIIEMDLKVISKIIKYELKSDEAFITESTFITYIGL